MRRFVLVLVLSAVAAAQVSEPRRGRKTADAPDNSGPSPESLLRLAHDQAQELPASDRAALLSRAITAAERIAPDLARPWTEELFGLMPEVPEARRASLEMAPVLAVANNDVDFAMDLLERMDAPAPEALNAGNDPRIMTANNVFSRYWTQKGAVDLDRMRTVAAHLGATGVYPYGAFSPALGAQSNRLAARGRKTVDPPERDTAAAEALFAELVQQFRSRPISYAEINEFLRMVRLVPQVAQLQIPDPALREALGELVGAIDRLPTNNLPSVNFTITNNNGSAKLDNAASVLLMQTIPLLKRVDPRWAQQVIDQHADLAKVEQLTSQPAGPQRTTMSQGGSGKALAQAARAPSQLIPEYQLGLVRGLAENGATDRAAQIAASNTDPALRAVADAEIASGLAQRNPQQAASYLGQARQELDTIDDPAKKLRVVVSLASAAYAGGDRSGAAAYTNQGFTLGEEVVRTDYDANPDKPPMSLKGASDLGQLIATAMRLDAPDTVARINNIRYPILRAHLMVSAAEAATPRNARLAGGGVMGGVVGSGVPAPPPPPQQRPQPPE